MMHRKSCVAAVVVAVAMVAGCKGRTGAIPNYEVLPVPKGLDQYGAGRMWVKAVGPSGPKLVPTTRESGPERMAFSASPQLKGQIEASLTEWAEAAIGVQSKGEVKIELGKTSFEYVVDAYDLKTTSSVLWETIIAESIVLKTSSDAHAGVNAELVGKKLQESLGGKIKLDASAGTAQSIDIKSDRPLVVAVRVATPQYDNANHRTRLDLSERAASTSQSGPFGYIVTVTQPVNPIESTATLRIDNSDLPQFLGELHEFRGAEPWVNKNRSAIAAADKKARGQVWVWDKLSVLWNRDLANCQLQTVRQYIRVRTVDSGLAGTR